MSSPGIRGAHFYLGPKRNGLLGFIPFPPLLPFRRAFTKILAREQFAQIDRNFVVGEARPQRHVGFRRHVVVDGFENHGQVARGAGTHNLLGLHAWTLG